MANPRPSASFKPGDKRINRKGRPKTLDALRTLAQQIAHKELAQKDGSTITVAEAILTGWAASNEPALQIKFVEYAWGKVPQPVEQKTDGKLEVIVRRGKSVHRPDGPSPGATESDTDGEAV